MFRQLVKRNATNVFRRMKSDYIDVNGTFINKNHVVTVSPTDSLLFGLNRGTMVILKTAKDSGSIFISPERFVIYFETKEYRSKWIEHHFGIKTDE